GRRPARLTLCPYTTLFRSEMLEELQVHYPRLRVVDHVKNRGYGGALRSGFASATKEWVFYTDGDAQYDPRELLRLVSKVSDQVEDRKSTRLNSSHVKISYA